jgi:hypothetical protein
MISLKSTVSMTIVGVLAIGTTAVMTPRIAAAAPSVSFPTTLGGSQRVLVPAYFYPTGSAPYPGSPSAPWAVMCDSIQIRTALPPPPSS